MLGLCQGVVSGGGGVHGLSTILPGESSGCMNRRVFTTITKAGAVVQR